MSGLPAALKTRLQRHGDRLHCLLLVTHPRGQQSHPAPSLQEVLGVAFKIRVTSLEGIDVTLTFLNRFEGHTFFEWQVLGGGGGGGRVAMEMGEANASPEGGERWAVNIQFFFFSTGEGFYLQGE